MVSAHGFKVFIIEDDPFYSQFLAHHLGLNPENELQVFHTAKACMDHLHEGPDAITLDYSLPDMTGAEALRKIKAQAPDIPVIVISGQQDVNTAINILKQGAHDYLVKDEQTKERLWHSLLNIRDNAALKTEIAHLKEEIGKKYAFEHAIVGTSAAMKPIFQLMEKAVESSITVSISGETGTGKELVAKAIHYNSKRRKESFIAVNVSAIPRDLLETEFFGHEKGAFTGASSRRIGKFEEADKGTLFLDEITEMDINLQAKLLRVLQEREITRIGDNKVIPVDVRIITATQKNLAEEVKKGNFREDLYYRLIGMPIVLPPLRDRHTDVLLLAKHFVEEFCKENRLPKKLLSNEAQKKVLKYQFPGNIRELKAIIELAVVMSNAEQIEAEDIRFAESHPNSTLINENTSLKDYNRQIIQQYLNKHQHNVVQVAEMLDISKSTIYRMLKDGELT